MPGRSGHCKLWSTPPQYSSRTEDGFTCKLRDLKSAVDVNMLNVVMDTRAATWQLSAAHR